MGTQTYDRDNEKDPLNLNLENSQRQSQTSRRQSTDNISMTTILKRMDDMEETRSNYRGQRVSIDRQKADTQTRLALKKIEWMAQNSIKGIFGDNSEEREKKEENRALGLTMIKEIGELKDSIQKEKERPEKDEAVIEMLQELLSKRKEDLKKYV